MLLVVETYELHNTWLAWGQPGQDNRYNGQQADRQLGTLHMESLYAPSQSWSLKIRNIDNDDITSQYNYLLYELIDNIVA